MVETTRQSIGLAASCVAYAYGTWRATLGYHITHWLGDMESSRGDESFGSLYDELTVADGEHPDVSVTNESGWSLGLGRNGRAHWENVEDLAMGPRHLDSVDRDRFIKLATAVAHGEFDLVEVEDWQPGY